jgi:hypothetical protein
MNNEVVFPLRSDKHFTLNNGDIMKLFLGPDKEVCALSLLEILRIEFIFALGVN